MPNPQEKIACKICGKPLHSLPVHLSSAHKVSRESYLSQLARSGLLWNTLPLLCSNQDSLRRGAEELLENAIRAGYFHEVQYAAETDPDPAVRTAAARLLEKCGAPLVFNGAEHPAEPAGASARSG